MSEAAQAAPVSPAPAAAADPGSSVPAAAAGKGPPPLDPRLTDAQTLKRNPEPLPQGNRPTPPLLMNRFAIEEFKNPTKWACVPEGTPIDAIVDEAFWAQCANAITICDVIRVHIDDRSWYAELYVRDKGRNWVKASFIKKEIFDAPVAEAPIDPGFEVAFKGPVNKWCVIRKSDGEKISTKHETKEGAGAALAQHVRGMR